MSTEEPAEPVEGQPAVPKKQRWASYAEKASLAVLGFVAVFLFNSIITLQNQVSALQEKRSGDVAQWEMLRQHTLAMAQIQASQMVHDKIIKDYTSQLINRKIVVEFTQSAGNPMPLAGPPEPTLAPSDTAKALSEMRKLHVEPVERFQQRMIQQYEGSNKPKGHKE
jgi:hypothetical protein